MGGGNYSQIAPAKSFIDVRDFSNIEELAKYLKYLDKNTTAYAEYFEWKKYFSLKFDFTSPFCKLCQALNNPNEPSKHYADIDKWWRSDAHCQSHGSFFWSRSYLETGIMVWKAIRNYIYNLFSDG